MKIEIVKTHIENDIRNNKPSLVFTDKNGEEWVLSHRSICYKGGGTMDLEKKKDSWYWRKD